jgi:hypothetical protein
MSGDPAHTPPPAPAPSRAHRVAERIWERAAAGAIPAGDVDATVEQVLTIVEAGLRRWIGAEGYAGLLSRAAMETLPTAPALAGISDVVTEPLEGVGQTTFTPVQTQQAVVALLVTMIRLLGTIIGEDMAIRLIELSGTPSTRGIAGAETNDLPS